MKKEENRKLVIENILITIENTYNYTKNELEKINFNEMDKEALIDFLNNCKGKYFDISTGKITNKLPNSNQLKVDLVNICESQRNRLIEQNILMILTLIAKEIEFLKDNELVKRILEEASKSENDKIRLKSALVLPEYIQFKNDSNTKIRAVAHLKSEYERQILNYSDEELKLIEYLGESIKKEIIKFEECPVDMDYDSTKRNIVSDYFNEENARIDYILTEIADKKLVANSIFKLLLESKLTFNEIFEPPYWNDILTQNGLEKVIVYQKINK